MSVAAVRRANTRAKTAFTKARRALLSAIANNYTLAEIDGCTAELDEEVTAALEVMESLATLLELQDSNRAAEKVSEKMRWKNSRRNIRLRRTAQLSMWNAFANANTGTRAIGVGCSTVNVTCPKNEPARRMKPESNPTTTSETQNAELDKKKAQVNVKLSQCQWARA